MAFILTLLGKGGVGKTTVAIAAAQQCASQGKRTLLVGHGFNPVITNWLGASLGADPQTVAPNLTVVQLRFADQLQQGWDQIKALESEYLRSPVLKSIFAEELAVLPGMDSALVMTALQTYDAGDQYDCIVYDGTGDGAMLRMLGTPEALGWYIRRFRQILADSDLVKTILPFLQPLIGSVFNLDWTTDNFSQPANRFNTMLDQGKTVISDPSRMAAYLVTTPDPGAIAMARYLWGCAQQSGLTVSHVILNRLISDDTEFPTADFAPLPMHPLPRLADNHWQPALDALPDLATVAAAPRSMTVDLVARQVRLFLPGFDKTQVKLSQNGPEVTIEAGDQRRNILLPPELSGQPVRGAKFQDGYLLISF